MWPIITLCLALTILPSTGRAGTWQDCRQIDDADRAVRSCTEIIDAGREKKNDLSMAYSNRAGAFVNMGEYDRAIADGTKAIELDPKNINAYGNRGNAYAGNGQHDQAI